MTWKYWVIRKMNPFRAKNAIATDPLAAVKRGLRNSATSTIGCAVRASAATKAASTATPAASTLMVVVEPQPQLGAWMTPNTSRPIATADSARPRQSTGGVRGSREVGTAQAITAATTAATGAMNTKMLPH